MRWGAELDCILVGSWEIWSLEYGIGLPSPQPSPKLGRGSKRLRFSLRLPFSHNWEKGLGDEGEGAGMHSTGFEFGIAGVGSLNIFQIKISL
jgi:hypothetical protein